MFERHACLREDSEDVDPEDKDIKDMIFEDKDTKDKPDVFLM